MIISFHIYFMHVFRTAQLKNHQNLLHQKTEIVRMMQLMVNWKFSRGDCCYWMLLVKLKKTKQPEESLHYWKCVKFFTAH